MSRWMSEHTLIDRIRNNDMRNNLGVANIEEIMKDNRKKIWAFAMTMY